jgi:hypothetical protein
MKYLELFEKFSNEYFKEITSQQYTSRVFEIGPRDEYGEPEDRPWNGNEPGPESFALDINDSEFDEIHKMIETLYDKLSMCINKYFDEDHPSKSLSIRDGKRGKKCMFITKLPDEWYCICIDPEYVFMTTRAAKYYLCDQFEGLKKCIDYIKKEFFK